MPVKELSGKLGEGGALWVHVQSLGSGPTVAGL